MTSPAPEPSGEQLDLNALSAEDVTVPTPEFVDPPPPTPGGINPPSRPWRTGTKRRTTKVPPRKTTPNTVETAVKAIPKPRRGHFVKPLTQTYTSIGIMMMPIDAVCGNLFIQNAEATARAWDEAAYENDAVRVYLTKFLQTSVATRIVMAHFPIMLGMMLHHSKRAQDMLGKMGEGFAETVENNMRVGDMGNGIEEP